MPNPTGAHKSKDDPRDLIFASVAAKASDLPRKFSRRGEQSPVFVQKFGMCVGATGKAFLEWLANKQGTPIGLSGRLLYAFAKQYDGIPGQEGTMPRTMLKVMAGLGTRPESEFPTYPSPDDHASFIKVPDDSKLLESAIEFAIMAGYARCTTIEDIKQAIYQFGPVLLTVNVFDTFDAAGSDGWIGPKISSASYRGSHEVLCIGWDDDKNNIGALEIKNSWGEAWGDHGFGFVSYNYERPSNNPFIEAWSILDTVNAAATKGAPVALAYPVDAPFITQGFGENPSIYQKYGMNGHNGIDFRAKKAAPIYACDAGSVVFTGAKGDYGNAVVISHAWGTSICGHLSSFAVSDAGGPEGSPQPVAKGQLIGYSGYTGHVIPAGPDGEHLHFGIRINGVKNPGFFDYVDPSPYFQKKGSQMYQTIIIDKKAGVADVSGRFFSGGFADSPEQYQKIGQEYGVKTCEPDGMGGWKFYPFALVVSRGTAALPVDIRVDHASLAETAFPELAGKISLIEKSES